jgi:DUF2935 family protein
VDLDKKSDISFWLPQLIDHSLFLKLGLEEPTLWNEADRLYAILTALLPQVATLSVDDAVKAIENPLKQLRDFESFCIDRGNQGKWIGWLFPMFIEHIRDEQDYFWQRVTASLTPAQEMCSWLGFMGQHCAFAQHLLDPSEGAKMQDALNLLARFVDLSGGCNVVNDQLLLLSQTAGTDLDAYLKNLGVGTPKLRSVIHPVLAAHVVREGQRFLDTVTALRAGGTLSLGWP